MKNFKRTANIMKTLSEKEILDNPLDQFEQWLAEALAAGMIEPTAMALATVDEFGRPSARMVLLKEVSESGFVFFTNYQSRKGKELLKNPHAALVFWWDVLQRQVRIEGKVRKISTTESDVYFSSRPLGSRIGAWASNQSEIIDNYRILEQQYLQIENKFAGKSVKRPAHWGGYRLKPDRIEFWQGRPNRLHDRLRFQKIKSGNWKIERLSP